MPSLRGAPPKAMDRPATRDGDNGVTLPVASRTSSLHSRIAQPLPSALSMKTGQRAPKTLTHAYMVCGVGREPSQWVKAPPPPQGKIAHMKGAVGQFWLPEILGSSPRLEQDNEIARSLHAAMRACFPHDVEICTGKSQPHCVHHSFVLQQDSSHTLYGIALRVWSRADEKRAETIRELRKRTEPDYYDTPDETYWIPYCLSFLSRYPLYNLLGDYLRGMWIHWNKATNLFHAEEVSRILSFPAPRLNDLVRIDMKDYALCYQFPSSPTGFQNFSLWPLFSCLSIPNLVGVLEAAMSSTRRIIFLSHFPAMLTVAAETVRFCVRVYEWSGLYVPVVHSRHVRDLVQEPGPYILGVTSECRSLFTAPPDVLVVDLDRNYVMTSNPPDALSGGRRAKMITRLTQALDGDVVPSGVPQHLRSAYGGGKLIPAGQIIIMKGEVESVRDPEWWNQDAVMAVMDGVCEKLSRGGGAGGGGVRRLFGGNSKKPLVTKVSMRHLNEIVRERNQYSRDAAEAWQDFINLKGRMDTELSKVTKRNNFLVEELESWKQQFLKFQAFAEQLTKETQDLKLKVENHKRENRRLAAAVEQAKDETTRLTTRLAGTEKQRDDALEALVLQQEIAEELERERQRNKKDMASLQARSGQLLRQRDEAHRVVLHLRALIDGQSHHMEHIVKSLNSAPELSDMFEDRDAGKGGSAGVGVLESVRESIGLGAVDSKGSSSSSSSSSSPGDQATKDTGKRLSMTDVADRYLRERTDSIAYIIRNISEQCAAAVESLHLAQNANAAAGADTASTTDQADPSLVSEAGDDESTTTAAERHSIPPTPDLEHHRASTALSTTTEGTMRDPESQPELRTKIAGQDEAVAHDESAAAVVGKQQQVAVSRPAQLGGGAA